jgi:hypothetical protein
VDRADLVSEEVQEEDKVALDLAVLARVDQVRAGSADLVKEVKVDLAKAGLDKVAQVKAALGKADRGAVVPADLPEEWHQQTS